MLWSGPCSRNQPVTLIASSVINQLFCLLPLGHQSVEGWCFSKGVDFLPQWFCIHLFSPICSCLPHPQGFVRPISQFKGVHGQIQQHPPPCILDPEQDILQQTQIKGTDFTSQRLLWSNGKTPTFHAKLGFAHLSSVPCTGNYGCLISRI